MSEVTETKFEYVAGNRQYRGLLLRPLHEAPTAAVVLLPDWRGQSSLARDHASYLIELGCTVVIADLYGDGFNPDSPDQVAPMVQRLIENRAEGFDALDACVAGLRQEVPVGTTLLCLGYSVGGDIALDYGRSGGDVDGIILCSAMLRATKQGMATRIPAPVLVLQGTQDQISPMEEIAAVIAEMDAAGNDVSFVLFSQTHHAFDNPEAGSDPTARLVYSQLAARRAREAIASFVAEVSKKEKNG